MSNTLILALLVPVVFVFVVFFVKNSTCSGELQILFAGDLLLDRGVRQKINQTGVLSLFENMVPLLNRDGFFVANLECPATKKVSPVSKKYIFRAEPEWLIELRKAGLTHLVMANNHTCDQGRQGLRETNSE